VLTILTGIFEAPHRLTDERHEPTLAGGARIGVELTNHPAGISIFSLPQPRLDRQRKVVRLFRLMDQTSGFTAGPYEACPKIFPASDHANAASLNWQTKTFCYSPQFQLKLLAQYIFTAGQLFRNRPVEEQERLGT